MPSLKRHVSTSGNETWKVLFRETVTDPETGVKTTRQRSNTYPTEAGARTFLALIEQHGPTRAIEIDDALADAGVAPVVAEGESLASLGASWLAARAADKASGAITPRTYDNYRRDWERWIKPHLGMLRATEVTDRDVQNWVDWMRLQPRCSHKSIADRKATLGMIYRWGTTFRGGHVVSHNPCIDIELPRRGYKPPKGLRMHEVALLMDAAREMYPPAADMIAFMLGTGWRLQEAMALTVAQVEDDGIDVWVTMSRVWRRDVGFVDGGKSEAAHRRIRVLGEAVEVLRRRCEGKANGDLVFTVIKGTPWTDTGFRVDYLDRISKAAGLVGDRRPTPHWLRHTHVLICHTAGMSLAEIQRRIGHSDIRMTINTYGKLIGDMNDDVAARLDAILARPSTDGVVRGSVGQPAPQVEALGVVEVVTSDA